LSIAGGASPLTLSLTTPGAHALSVGALRSATLAPTVTLAGGGSTLTKTGAGTLTIGAAQSWSSAGTLGVAGGVAVLASNPGSDSGYNLAAIVTPATGTAARLDLAGSATGELIQLR